MKQQIIINADSYETRIAILEDDELVELLVERAEQRRNVGDIYKGRVNAVLPGHAVRVRGPGARRRPGSCTPPTWPRSWPRSRTSPTSRRAATAAAAAAGPPAPKIEDHLKKGQEILVQITKESIGTKGPRVTQQVSLPGPLLRAHAGRGPRRRVAPHRGPRRAPAHQGHHHGPQAQGRRPDRAHRRRGQGRSRVRRRRQAPAQAVAEDRPEGRHGARARRWCTASWR